MMNAAERRAFVRQHRTCIFGFARKQGPPVEEMATKEKRVVIRFTPESTVYTPPQHLHAGDDGSKLVHGLAQRMPWRE